ncbi:MAG: malto-oligosyltrehalose synthase [Chloroflexaceae bacterium]|nr:malto-oligosyltrehalose synthase [Chloroflexaceae bacterium]
MNHYLCIHGHFYQPPRENPWLEAVELQDSAYPYHDWNERITAECYEPNTGARILDSDGRIAQIVSNYARISFNFGPTLLRWMEQHEPAVYQAILLADREGQKRFSGHGTAIAQVYNHLIMPLANRRDKVTQVVWGIRDFAHRFERPPEGMWLAETAVDLETLDILAEHGIRFTILSPTQAARVRPMDGSSDWQSVGEGIIDPTMPYLQHLPSGRMMALFFYDIPISRAVAFEGLLSSGDRFARRLLGGFDNSREHPQLVHFATDGESYGHHHHRGEMALAYALHHIETNGLARLTCYGEFLELSPPTHEVEIIERTSWSCPHGVGRWYRDCGCNTGSHPSWNQAWREPLRAALDWLRDTVTPYFEEHGARLFYDPWDTRNDYISVILDRSLDNVAPFLARHTTHGLDASEQVQALQLLELQRQLLLMYASCGWYFDDLSGIETVQVMKYAGRAIHLATMLSGNHFEAGFLDLLEQARSNLPDYRHGRHIYERWVRPAAVDLTNLGAHYAISSLSERYPARTTVYCYEVETEDYHRFEPGLAKVVIGRARMTSMVTRNTEVLSFGVLHFGDHNVNAGVRPFPFDDEASYQALVEGAAQATAVGDIAEVVRLLDGYFHKLEYSAQSLFRDTQRSFLNQMLESTLADDEAIYRQLYERRTSLMQLLTSLSTPLPRTWHATAEFVLNSDLRRAVAEIVPDQEHIQTILERAQMWEVELDTAGLAYTIQETMEQLVRRVHDCPNERETLQSLESFIDVIRSMPFEVDFWKIQNAYFELVNTVYVEMQECADEGDEDARLWATHFISLGDKLGIRVAEMNAISAAPTVASIVHEVLSQQRIPRATYRFQFNPSFTFRDALNEVPYLDGLGISHCYASPIFKARAGSSHGYDVCDPGQINPALGGEEDFHALTEELRRRGMSVLLDIVPNHMGIGDVGNTWWMDVLENGPSSDYAAYFDIEWNPVKPELANKVLLPTLGDQYGRVLERGELRLVYQAEEGTFFLHYYEHLFPIAPGTYRMILNDQLETLMETLGTEHEHMQEFQSIITALSYLPPPTERDPQRLIERSREKEVIKRRIASLYQESPDVRAAIDTAVQAFNGNIGDPHSFDLLDTLINAQSYRLAFWRVAAEEVNYRRFFDINDLAAIRTEDPVVFQDTHQLVFRLLTEGHVSGLRIDHIDGLFDPEAYFRQLQEGYVFHKVRDRLARVRKTMPDDATLRQRVASRIAAWVAEYHGVGPSPIDWPLYVVAEKILGEDESLPRNWAVHGTVGYDFLTALNSLFVPPQNRAAFDTIYQQFTGNTTPFHELVNMNKKRVMLISMDSEIYALSHQLERIAERNRRYRDFTLNMLTFAIREVIACLSVYRTYTTDSETVLPRDRHFIETAVAESMRRNPRTPTPVFDFIREILLLEKLSDFGPEDQHHLIQWVRKFQQVTGPVMAKGVEDTAFYVYNRLVSLNEVGGHPEEFGRTVEQFHKRNQENQRSWSHTLLSTSTHDTKRSEDVRARINVLSELPEKWRVALSHWSALNASKKALVDGKPAPDGNDEYLFYQTLVGAWPFCQQAAEEALRRGKNESESGNDSKSSGFPTSPVVLNPFAAPEPWADFRERMTAYMHKATKEAKVHTSWVNANQAYDSAVRDFVIRTMTTDEANGTFLKDMRDFVEEVAYYGRFNALTQTLLKLTAPGVPDIYQGTELWDLSLVDPDNRRPVDYAVRRALLDDLKQRMSRAGDHLVPLARYLLDTSHTGQVKLYLISRVLGFRRAHANLFAHGSYDPLEVTADQRDHVCAFARTFEEETMLVVAPRLIVQLTGDVERPPMGPAVWGNTRLVLPEEAIGQRYRHHLTGEVLSVEHSDGVPGLGLAEICQSFPVAVLERL